MLSKRGVCWACTEGLIHDRNDATTSMHNIFLLILIIL